MSIFAFYIISFTAVSQELVIASNNTSEPIGLYKKVNESLTVGNTKLALNIFEEVIDFFEEEGRVRELSQNYLGMALSLALNGNYPESIQYHKKALRAHRKYRRNESADDIIVNLALTYELAGKVKKSKRLLARL